ncbi:MAG: hypothetical protein JKY65_15670 [Planctomycetes bacterium]|nr:hypothetical protein [Planctomycetota bacterium]
MLIFGTTTYGATDAIEGVGKVVTRFAHLYYLPLIPLGSYFLTKHPDLFRNNPEGVRIRFSWKSLVLAYARALLGAPAIAAVLSCFVLFGLGKTTNALACLGASVGLGLLAGVTYLSYFRAASSERAKALLEEIGIPPRQLAELLEGSPAWWEGDGDLS